MKLTMMNQWRGALVLSGCMALAPAMQRLRAYLPPEIGGLAVVMIGIILVTLLAFVTGRQALPGAVAALPPSLAGCDQHRLDLGDAHGLSACGRGEAQFNGVACGQFGVCVERHAHGDRQLRLRKHDVGGEHGLITRAFHAPDACALESPDPPRIVRRLDEDRRPLGHGQRWLLGLGG